MLYWNATLGPPLLFLHLLPPSPVSLYLRLSVLASNGSYWVILRKPLCLALAESWKIQSDMKVRLPLSSLGNLCSVIDTPKPPYSNRLRLELHLRSGSCLLSPWLSYFPPFFPCFSLEPILKKSTPKPLVFLSAGDPDLRQGLPWFPDL